MGCATSTTPAPGTSATSAPPLVLACARGVRGAADRHASSGLDSLQHGMRGAAGRRAANGLSHSTQ